MPINCTFLEKNSSINQAKFRQNYTNINCRLLSGYICKLSSLQYNKWRNMLCLLISPLYCIQRSHTTQPHVYSTENSAIMWPVLYFQYWSLYSFISPFSVFRNFRICSGYSLTDLCCAQALSVHGKFDKSRPYRYIERISILFRTTATLEKSAWV